MQAALVSSVSLHLTPDFIKFKVENNDSHEWADEKSDKTATATSFWQSKVS
jgi:hypothetical protein